MRAAEGRPWIGARVGGTRGQGRRSRSERAAAVEWPPREPLPEARRAHPRDRSRAGHDRGHRASHQFRARLPRLAAVPRPAHPAARRLEGVDRVDPPDRRGGHRRSRSSPSRSWPIRDYRDRRSILWPALGAVGLVGFQAWLGRETVRLGNSGESVTAHLAAALRARRAARLPDRPGRLSGPDRRARGEPAVHPACRPSRPAVTFALLLFGSHVTATSSALVFPDWPLMNGSLFPSVTDVTAAHVLHRWVAAVVGLIVATLAVVAWRTQRDHPTLVRLAVWSGRAVRGPGRHRRRPGRDQARRVDADAAPRARGRHLGDADRADRHELLHGSRRRSAPGSGEVAGAGPDATTGPAHPGRHRSAPTSR